jgi:hypothetical protein
VSGGTLFSQVGALTVDDTLRLVPQALLTCAAGIEGALATVAGAGDARTKLCMCTSDGTGTPAFAWQNVVTGALGDTTTCG